jgi:hypothetical protein
MAQKSIVFSGSIYQHLLIANGTFGFCGNLVCEYGENIYNCPGDCLPVSFPGNGTAATGTVPNGAYCDNNTWCLSGSCNFNECVGIGDGESCVSSAQCDSGSCDINNHCESKGFAKTLQNFFGNIFGNSFLDLLLVGLLIMAAFTLILGLMGAALGIIGGLVGAGTGFIIGLLFATSLGFIPVWFLFVFVMLIIAIIFIFALSSNR